MKREGKIHPFSWNYRLFFHRYQGKVTNTIGLWHGKDTKKYTDMLCLGEIARKQL